MSLRFDFPLALLGLLALPLLVPVALYGADRVNRARRVAAAVVRLLLVACAIIALAGPAIVRQSNHLATIFLVDASDSVGPDGVTSAQAYIKSALAKLPHGDEAGIVVFGDNALVERSVSADPDLGPLLSKPATGHTDLAGAVRLGLALFPEGFSRRLVVISDGQENKGDLATAATAAAASGVEISTHTLQVATGDEALVSEVRAPARAREGETIDVNVTVQSTLPQSGQLRLFADGNLLAEQTVDLKAGDNAFTVTVKQPSAGFHRFRAEIKAGADTHWQNNTASAFTDVKGRARVLLLEGKPGGGDNLAAALTASGLLVDRLPADRAPATLPELVNYDAVLLVDAAADTLGARAAVLQSYVRDLGRGLVIVGGERAYGPGGYAGTPLEDLSPVRMELRNGVVNPPVSLVFALDKSGSMSESGTGANGGVSKMDLAKEAAFRAIKLLQPQDQIGIVAFDSAAYWVAPLKALRDQPDILNQLGSLRAGGGTDIRAGLAQAVQAQLGSASHVRHIILVTDGQSNNNFADLIQQLHDNNITLSIVGVGQDVAPYLPQLAAAGGGRYYFAADPSQLPDIFLQETRLALRSYFIEGDIGPRLGSPSPITDGITAMPNLRGYVGTTAKPTAATVLVSDQGDPLLAQWQYGLGRVVAWTSDAKGQWAVDWLGWPDFARFWSRTVNWTIAAAPQDLQLTTRMDGDHALVTVDARDPSGNYRNGLTIAGTVVGPDGARRDITLRQTAPGRYEADLGALTEGAHLLAVVAKGSDGTPQAATTGGLIVPYSPEYALPRVDRAPLTRARDLTGGTELADPAAAFAHTLPPARQSRAVWPPFL
ncbi:MAG: VWA domain-containing protein, partial [Thermomicrobiales bacterium]